MTTRFTTMPPEILLAITDLLPQAALHALALADKRLYDVINSTLYAQSVKDEAPDITVLAARDGNLDTLKMAASFGADMNRVYWVPVPTWAKPEEIQSTAPKTGFDIEDSSDDDLDHRGTIMALEEVEDHNRMDAAHSAAASGQREILRYLIAKGTDINTFDGSNGNVLHYALSESDTDMCKLVVGLGADTATPIEFAVRNMNGSSIVSVVEWAANYCPGKTEVISRALSHIAERGDSFWKVDEGSGKTMVISSIFDFGCYNDELMEPEYNKWISQFLQGAILTCDLSNAGNLEEELLLCFAINATSLTSGPDVLDMILDATGSLRALFYGDSQKLDMKKVVFPNTPVWRRLGEGQVEPANELGTLLIQDLNEWVNVTDSMVQTDWKQRRLKRARDMIDWLLDHGATPPKP
ncbi:hypothetical protein KNSL1_012169 [Colletotrichum chrysophilum]|nr:hypothetical protein KNSL1_012169 [Colletotrichum chrysophilum]